MDTLIFLTFFLVFFLGAIFGSFLNVVVVELEILVFSEKKLKERLKIF
jgi:uncharacterized membrane protein YoaK (UPF0700 family)